MKNLVETLEKILFTVTGRMFVLKGNQNFKRELAIDSLTMVEVVLETEAGFGIVFEQSELCEENLKDTQSFIGLLEKKCNE